LPERTTYLVYIRYSKTIIKTELWCKQTPTLRMSSNMRCLTQNTTPKRTRWLNTMLISSSPDSVNIWVRMKSNILRDIQESTSLRSMTKFLRRSLSTIPGRIMPPAPTETTKWKVIKLPNRDIYKLKIKRKLVTKKCLPIKKQINTTLKRSSLTRKLWSSRTPRRRHMSKLSTTKRIVSSRGPSKISTMRSKPNKRFPNVMNHQP